MTEHLSQMQIHALLDGELEPAQRQALNTHLAECASCRGELAAAEQLFSAIGGIPDEQLTTDLVPGVLAAIQPAPRWLRSLAVGELLLALAVGIGLLFGLGSETVSLRVVEAAQQIGAGVESLAQSIVATATNALPDPNSLRIDLGMPAVWSLAVAALIFWALSNGLLLRRATGRDRA